MRTRTVLGLVAGLAAAAAVVAVAVPVVRGSDALTTDSRVAPDNPMPPEVGPLPASVRPLWTAASALSTTSVEGPTAVATGDDRVAGLDPASGRERWSYTRGNARLCDVTVRDGVVIALFAKSQGCRDLIGLDAATGARRWTRTVEFTADAVLSSAPGVVVVTGGDRMIAADSGGGLNRWTWAAAGCVLDPAVAGRLAVATIARCGAENRLVVHLPYAEQAPWVGPLPGDPRVVSGDERVAVLTGTALTVYTTGQDAEGKFVATAAGTVTDPRLAGADRAGAVAEGDMLVTWTGTTAVAADVVRRRVVWTAPATSAPVLAEGQVLLAGSGGFTTRPSTTGAPVTSIAAPGIPAGGALARIGRLVVTAAGGTITAYG
jgi:hypothetical protein